MDSSSLTLPNLSQPGQKSTVKKLTRPEVKNFLTNTAPVYQRAGWVLPRTFELFPLVDIKEVIAASNDDKKRLALPQTLIDIQTALVDGYSIVLTIELYEEMPKKGGNLTTPNTDKEIIDVIQIVLVGYDRETQMFAAQSTTKQEFSIAYDYVVDELAAFDLWAIVK